MCNCKGRKGDQGETGPDGVVSLTAYPVTSGLAIDAPTSEVISAAVASTGNLVFWGHITFADADVSVQPIVTVTPTVNGVSVTASVGRATMRQIGTIAVTGKVAITAGQQFKLVFTASNYAGDLTVTSGVILYSIG